MSNVIDLAARRAAAKPAPEPAAELPAAMQQAIEQNFAAPHDTIARFGFAHSLVGQTLAFYANQGFDHGARARAALQAMDGALTFTTEAQQ
jgi:hypothetical protein